MKAQYHAIAGGVAAALLTPVFGVHSAVFFASSVLIDGDHYLDFLYRNGFTDLSIKRMFIFHDILFRKRRERNLLILHAMHTIEFLCLVYLASVVTEWMWLRAAFWGMLFHMALDLAYMYWKAALSTRALSAIEYIIRWRQMKRRGLQPELLYQSILHAMSLPSGAAKDETD